MDKQLTVLITRPQPGADAFAAMLPGLETLISPMMRIEALKADLGAPDVVIMTSAHAIPQVAALVPRPECYCVGSATTNKARAAGLNAVMAGETASDLAARVIADQPKGAILYARGRHVAFDMLEALQAGGVSAQETVVYDQVPYPLSDDAMAALQTGQPLVLPLFSARSAALFFEACPDAARLHIVAISPAVAQCVPAPLQQHMAIVPNPDAQAMAQSVRKAALDGKRLEQGG